MKNELKGKIRAIILILFVLLLMIFVGYFILIKCVNNNSEEISQRIVNVKTGNKPNFSGERNIKAIIVDSGSPAVDGCGYLIRINNKRYSANIPSEFLVDDLDVLIDYENVSSVYSCSDGGVEKYDKIIIANIKRFSPNNAGRCGANIVEGNYRVENCNRACNSSIDCKYTCGCGAINKNENCFDEGIIFDCVDTEANCVDNKCREGRELIGEN